MVSTLGYIEGMMSVKGQVVVPQAIRDAAGLVAGMKLRFKLSPAGKVEIEPVKKRRLEDLIGILHRSGRKPLELDKIDDMIMDAVAAKYGYPSKKRSSNKKKS